MATNERIRNFAYTLLETGMMTPDVYQHCVNFARPLISSEDDTVSFDLVDVAAMEQAANALRDAQKDIHAKWLKEQEALRNQQKATDPDPWMPFTMEVVTND